MAKISSWGIFNLLERLSMKFPEGKSGLDVKVAFEEKVNFMLTNTETDKTVKGDNN